MAGAHLSREFFDLIKAIGEAKSKQVRGWSRAGGAPRGASTHCSRACALFIARALVRSFASRAQ